MSGKPRKTEKPTQRSVTNEMAGVINVLCDRIVPPKGVVDRDVSAARMRVGIAIMNGLCDLPRGDA